MTDINIAPQNLPTPERGVPVRSAAPTHLTEDAAGFEKLLNKGKSREKDSTLQKLFTQSEKTLTSSVLHEKGSLSQEGKSSALDDNSGLGQQGLNHDIDEKALPNPESMLSFLSHPQGQVQPQNIQGSQGAESHVQISPEDVQEIADRILVATPKEGGAEVRISITEKALPGTEVTLTRSLDGQLTVKFTTENANSFQTLVATQENLKNILRHSNSDVRVEISSEQNDSDRESRGKQQYSEEKEEN